MSDTPPSDPSIPPPDADDEIPGDATPRAQERIRALTAERTGLRSQLAAIAPRLAEATTLRAELDALRGQHAAEVSARQAAEVVWQTKHAILAAGITDPEAEDIVAGAYGRVAAPEGGAKPTLSEWLANREALPRGVRAYLSDAAPASAPVAPSTSAGAAAPSPPPPPRPNAGAASAPTASPAIKAPHLMTAAEYAQVRTAHLASLKPTT